MPRALLFVESKPASPEEAAAYQGWHEDIHIPEMLGVDGFVAARRRQAEDGGSFITLYEIDTDIETARLNLKAAVQAGQMSKPVGVQMQPPPVQRYLTFMCEAIA